MKRFLDTADVTQIRGAWSRGIVDGITTNPSHVAKTGRRALEVYKEILGIVDCPVSLETISLDAPGIIGRVGISGIEQRVELKCPPEP